MTIQDVRIDVRVDVVRFSRQWPCLDIVPGNRSNTTGHRGFDNMPFNGTLRSGRSCNVVSGRQSEC